MNEIAEKGLAAHFKYKEGTSSEDRFDKWFVQIREALGNQQEDGVDFLQDFKTSFLAEEIYVLVLFVTLIKANKRLLFTMLRLLVMNSFPIADFCRVKASTNNISQ